MKTCVLCGAKEEKEEDGFYYCTNKECINHNIPA